MVITDTGLISVGSELISVVMLIRLRDFINTNLKKEYSSETERGCIVMNFAFKLMIEKCLNHNILYN